MIIATNFDVNDIAWININGLAKKVRISHIQINSYTIGVEAVIRIWYECDGNVGMYKETEFFKSKEALLQSL